jgi:hypothetical protein
MLQSSKLLARIPVPPLAMIRQDVVDDSITDVAAATRESFRQSPLAASLRPGMRVAIGVGSRNFANTPTVVRETVAWFKEHGARPFIVPAMGSHGKATDEGQKELLATQGVTEESMGCPIISSMEVVEVGRLENGFPVYMDRNAFEADAVFVVNRVKLHPSFRGKHESGIIKMVTIGLGKQAGAESCHALGYKKFPELLPKMAALVMSKANFLGGLAVVENFLDKTCIVEAIPTEKMFERDAALLRIAAAKMPSLPFDKIDALIIDEVGKNINGGGMDANVVGRYATQWMNGGPEITCIGLLDITDESHGNGHGTGFADIITHRMRDKLDFEAAYVNSLTSTTLRACAMPCALATDRDVFRAAVKCCHQPDLDKLRFARIKNTLMLKYIRISPALIPDALEKGCRLVAEPLPVPFAENGELVDRNQWPG